MNKKIISINRKNIIAKAMKKDFSYIIKTNVESKDIKKDKNNILSKNQILEKFKYDYYEIKQIFENPIAEKCFLFLTKEFIKLDKNINKESILKIVTSCIIKYLKLD